MWHNLLESVFLPAGSNPWGGRAMGLTLSLNTNGASTLIKLMSLIVMPESKACRHKRTNRVLWGDWLKQRSADQVKQWKALSLWIRANFSSLYHNVCTKSQTELRVSFCFLRSRIMLVEQWLQQMGKCCCLETCQLRLVVITQPAQWQRIKLGWDWSLLKTILGPFNHLLHKLWEGQNSPHDWLNFQFLGPAIPRCCSWCCEHQQQSARVRENEKHWKYIRAESWTFHAKRHFVSALPYSQVFENVLTQF